jgi:hypothetical protein
MPELCLSGQFHESVARRNAIPLHKAFAAPGGRESIRNITACCLLMVNDDCDIRNMRGELRRGWTRMPGGLYSRYAARHQQTTP